MNPRTYRALLPAAPAAAAPLPIVAAMGAALTALAAALLASALWLAAPAAAALSPSAYRVDALCSAPPPGYAGCLGLRLVAKRPLSLRGSRASTRAAHATSPAAERIEFKEPWSGSLSPQNVLSAYNLSGVPAPPTRQTLALVDAFNDPTVEHDLLVFDERLGLPACTTANGCFAKVEMRGGSHNTTPPTNAGWAQEIATDVELAHGLCPSCEILLVEAHSNSNADLESAEREAERLGADEISNSWGGREQGVSAAEDNTSAFNHPGTVITASSGDTGYLNWGAEESSERGFANYPASSPHVVAVGGTRLGLTVAGAWLQETVWNGDGAGGGGCSAVLTAPPWQQSVTGWPAVGCSVHRAVADVSADADPYTGVAVYDSTPIIEAGTERLGWVTIGGTSVASPIVAATFALAGGAGRDAQGITVSYPARTLYEGLQSIPAALHDVTSGSNGACGQEFDWGTGESGCSLAEESASCVGTTICVADTGYDGPTGVGTPDGIAAFESASVRAQRESEGSSKEGGGGGSGGEGEGPIEPSEGVGGEGGEQPEGGTSAEGSSPGGSLPGNAGAPIGGEGSSDGTTGAPPIGRPASTSTTVPILSALALSRTATAALSHGRPRVSRIAFAFTLNIATRVRVTLAKRVRAHGRTRWQTLPYSLTIAGAGGRDHARLGAHGTLSSGRYRLVLIPANGTARTLTFPIR